MESSSSYSANDSFPSSLSFPLPGSCGASSHSEVDRQESAVFGLQLARLTGYPKEPVVATLLFSRHFKANVHEQPSYSGKLSSGRVSEKRYEGKCEGHLVLFLLK